MSGMRHDGAMTWGQQLLEALETIVLNATIIPDPRLGGGADAYIVPMEDIEKARELLAASQN